MGLEGEWHVQSFYPFPDVPDTILQKTLKMQSACGVVTLHAYISLYIETLRNHRKQPSSFKASVFS